MKNMFFKNVELGTREGYFTIYYLNNDEEIEYLNIAYNSFIIRDEKYVEYYLDDEYALEYWEFTSENRGVIRSIFDDSSYEDITFDIIDGSIIKIEIFENGTNNLMSQRIVCSNGYKTLVINPALKEYCVESFEFIKNGPRSLYNEKDILLEEQEYKNGELIGTSKYYYESGNLKFLMNSNQTIEFYETGELKSKLYQFKKFSKTIDYYPTGGVMAAGTLNLSNEYEGVGWNFYENGKLKKICSYANNLIHGEYKDFYENGALKTDSFFILGKENCEYKSYYNNGQLECIIDLENGRRCGRHLKYYKSGQLESKTYYSNNAPVSDSIIYYENGNIATKLAYKNGLRVGISEWFYETGELKTMQRYDLVDGYSYLNYSKTYYKSGTLESYIQWEDTLCEHNNEDYSYNAIRGYISLEINYYENGKMRKKQKLIEKNTYFIERYNDDEVLIQKGTVAISDLDSKVFYWIGEVLTFDLWKSKNRKTVTTYSKDGRFLSKFEYIGEVLDRATTYLSDENLYERVSYYSNGNIRDIGRYSDNGEDKYERGICWIEYTSYSENGEIMEEYDERLFEK